MTRALSRTVQAAAWSYGGRAVGLGWTVLLVARLDVSSYGYYAMAYVLSTGLAGPLDNPFNVRAIRGSDRGFHGERAARSLLGAGLSVLGLVALVPAVRADGSGVWQVVWFALVLAGGEVAFNALKSDAVRRGEPQLVMRWDSGRQLASILCGSAVLLTAPQAGVLGASAGYAVPYLGLVVLALLRHLRRSRPALPGRAPEITVLVAEHAGNFAFLMSDVLVLGLLTDARTVGYYSLAQVVVFALMTLGQAFAMTFHEPLRTAGGAWSAGPGTRGLLAVTLGSAGIALVTSGGLWVAGADHRLVLSLALLAPFAATRALVAVLVVVLYTRRLDAVRTTTAWVLAPLKLGLLVLLLHAGWGAPGTAFTASVADLAMVAVFWRALARSGAPRVDEARP